MKYAYDRADRILRFYRRTDAWDPDVFLAGIAANLAEYPKDIIDEVADPAKGIASKCTFPPQPAEVRKACEAIARPRRERATRAASINAQLEERARLEAPRENRPTWEQVKAELIQRGFGMNGEKLTETAESVRTRLGLTQEQWDAIPDAPKDSNYWRGIRDCVPARKNPS